MAARETTMTTTLLGTLADMGKGMVVSISMALVMGMPIWSAKAAPDPGPESQLVEVVALHGIADTLVVTPSERMRRLADHTREWWSLDAVAAADLRVAGWLREGHLVDRASRPVRLSRTERAIEVETVFSSPEECRALLGRKSVSGTPIDFVEVHDMRLRMSGPYPRPDAALACPNEGGGTIRWQGPSREMRDYTAFLAAGGGKKAADYIESFPPANYYQTRTACYRMGPGEQVPGGLYPNCKDYDREHGTTFDVDGKPFP